jgi:type IV pilus assembly protein PilC
MSNRLISYDYSRLTGLYRRRQAIKQYFERFFTRPPTQRELATFTRQFAVMFRSGIGIGRSLGILEEQYATSAMRWPIASVSKALQMGHSISRAFAREKWLFGSLYISLLSAAEQHGRIDMAFEQLAVYVERDWALRERVRAALRYPLLVLSFTTLVTYAMVVFVLPGFLTMFSDMQSLPLPTRITMFFAWYLRNPWTVTFTLVSGCILWRMARRYLTTEGGRAVFDRWLLRLPAAGGLARKLTLARMSRSLGTLLGSGIVALEALLHAANTCDNQVYKEDLMQARERLKEGLSLTDYFLSDRVMYPALFAQMVSAGEHSGKLADMLVRAAENYEQEVEHQIEVVLNLLEPLLMVLLAVVVGFMALSLFLPIYGFLNTLQ